MRRKEKVETAATANAPPTRHSQLLRASNEMAVCGGTLQRDNTCSKGITHTGKPNIEV